VPSPAPDDPAGRGRSVHFRARRWSIGADEALLLPDGSRLLHIGPHKTGTTSVQGAFHHARRSVAAQGVHYAGPNRHARQAAQAAATRGSSARRWGSMRAWDSLVGEIRRARGRVVISSEWFADAEPTAAKRLIDDLDPRRVHVVVTLRPLARILASQWQQFVQGGVTIPYEQWLRTIFDEPTSGTGKRFWHRHRHDELIRRWAAVVGFDRLVAVVVDDRDHAAVLRVFEGLTGLADQTLELVPDRSNRSLTAPEVELVRAMNATFAGVGLSGPPRLDLVLFGAAANLKLRELEAEEPRIATPDWALQRAAGVAAEIVEGIQASGVRVVGDSQRLLGPAAAPVAVLPGEDAGAGAREERSWPEITTTGALGVLAATGLARSGDRSEAVEPYSSQRLRSILLGRVRDAVAGS